jgi:hypothetical protein
VSHGQDAAAARREQRLSFFRQSGWMLLATTVSGALMSMVHNSAGRIARDHSDQYGLFTTMLDTLLLLSIPAGGVQGV